MVSGEKMIENILENEGYKYNSDKGDFVKKEMIVDSFDFNINNNKYSFSYLYFGIDGKRFDQEKANSVQKGWKVQYLGPYQEGDLEKTLVTQGMKDRGFHEKSMYEVKDVNKSEKK